VHVAKNIVILLYTLVTVILEAKDLRDLIRERSS